jgi:cytochrome P450
VDVIASSVFGMKAGTVENPDSEFSKMAFRFANLSIYKMMLGMQFPWLAKMLQLEFIDMEALHWLKKILNEGLQQRLKGGPKRNDFLQLLADAKKGELKAVAEDELNDFEKDAMGHIKTGKRILLSDEVLNAQSLLFLLAGLSTTTNFIVFCLYALAAYPDVQKRLREEVDKIAKPDGDFDYDELNQLAFMEMFVCEVLRLNPGVTRLERECIKDYKEPETGLFIPKGTLVAIPVMPLHTDPKYYEEPDKFDPELHFSTDKKAGRSPYVYLPFGSGPRNCIGNRFALMEGKGAVAHIVHNFLIEPSDKTPMPMKGVVATMQVLPPTDLELKLTPMGK